MEPIGNNNLPLKFLEVLFLEGLLTLPIPTVEGDGKGPLAGPGARGGDEEDEEDEEDEDEEAEEEAAALAALAALAAACFSNISK